MILTGTILLKKAKDIKIMDMEDVATRMKHDRILQDAIVQFMANLLGIKRLSYTNVSATRAPVLGSTTSH